MQEHVCGRPVRMKRRPDLIFLHTHRHLYCGTNCCRKGIWPASFKPRGIALQSFVQRTRSRRVRIGDYKKSARQRGSHLPGNAGLPGTWFKALCAVLPGVPLPTMAARSVATLGASPTCSTGGKGSRITAFTAATAQKHSASQRTTDSLACLPAGTIRDLRPLWRDSPSQPRNSIRFQLHCDRSNTDTLPDLS